MTVRPSAAHEQLKSQVAAVEDVLQRIRAAPDVQQRARACLALGPAMTELETLKARFEASLTAAEAHDLAQRGVRLAAELQSVQALIEQLRDRWSSETN